MITFMECHEPHGCNAYCAGRQHAQLFQLPAGHTLADGLERLADCWPELTVVSARIAHEAPPTKFYTDPSTGRLGLTPDGVQLALIIVEVPE